MRRLADDSLGDGLLGRLFCETLGVRDTAGHQAQTCLQVDLSIVHVEPIGRCRALSPAENHL
jgi:hypothetical protein